MTYDKFLKKLQGVHGKTALCPAHDDKRRSLSHSVKNGKILIHCHAGCSVEDIVIAMGLKMSDLFDEPEKNMNIIKVYDYYDENNSLLFQVCRTLNKQFFHRRPDGHGSWIWDMKGIKPLPYKLPELKKALEAGETVFIVEGEKDANNLASLGLTATCNHGGAGKWKEVHSRHFPASSKVIILPDNDEPGRKHGQAVARQLAGRGCQVKVLELPGLPKKGDVSDWLAAGGTKEDLLKLIEETSNWVLETQRMEKNSSNYRFTDTENAELVAENKNLLFCHPWNTWMHCNGETMLWEKDRSGIVVNYASQHIPKVWYARAAACNDKQERQKIAAWARACESAARIKSMLELAKAKVPVVPVQFDQNKWLIKFLNMTFDLKEFKPIPHQREHLITKIMPVRYNPLARCDRWIAFLNEIFENNQDKITFLQRAVGSALTGITTDQAVFILYGTGANGKSTFITILLQLFGDYGLQTPAETFLLSGRGNLSNDIARLKGARFISAVEAGEGRRLDETLIKRLSGGDKITARFLHQEFFEFEIEGKIFLATNHRPVIKEADHGIWRRIRLIPFNVTFKEENQDKNLLDKLREELPGILNWTIEGCRNWQENGLGTPDEIQKATLNYQNEQDTVGQFIEDCTSKNPLAKIKVGYLYQAYLNWCKEFGEKDLSQRAFSQRLVERGIEKSERTRDGFFWRGIRLNEELEEKKYVPKWY